MDEIERQLEEDSLRAERHAERAARGESGETEPGTAYAELVRRTALAALADAIRPGVARDPGSAANTIIVFNDNPTTRREDVLAAFDRAIDNIDWRLSFIPEAPTEDPSEPSTTPPGSTSPSTNP